MFKIIFVDSNKNIIKEYSEETKESLKSELRSSLNIKQYIYLEYESYKNGVLVDNFDDLIDALTEKNNTLYILELSIHNIEDFQKNDKIFAFSDVHGDIDALICCLRNCAGVISGPEGWRSEAIKKLDERVLNDNGTINYELFDCFGFEWIGKNSLVVITGDIIDNYRPKYTLLEEKKRKQFEIVDEELKMIIFLRAMSKKAQEKGGNIITILGNHEFHNIKSDFGETYTTPYTKENKFRETERKELFKNFDRLLNNFLFINEKTIDCEKIIIFKKKNFLFMHGGLTKLALEQYISAYNSSNIHFIIECINKHFNQVLEYSGNDYTNKYKFYTDPEYSILWNRSFGEMFDTDEKYTELCSELDEVLKLFCQENSRCKDDTYVVIGHCPQILDKLDGKKTFSYNYSTVEYSGETQILSIPLKKNEFSKKSTEHLPLISGITVACHNKNNPYGRLFRIDVGMSRAFDGMFMIDKIEFKELLLYYFLSRTPQVLAIDYSTKLRVNIIRLNIRAMLKYMQRNGYYLVSDNYGNIVDFIPDKTKVNDINKLIDELDKPLEAETVYDSNDKEENIEINKFRDILQVKQDAGYYKYIKYKLRYLSLKSKLKTL